MQPQPSNTGRGVRFGGETLAIIPADNVLRPLRDQLIVEPLGVMHSRYILVVDSNKPVRGIVKAAGPGCYPKKYDHAEKHKRSKMWDSKRFQPTEVKVGDVVELGGAEHGGYSFESFWWGDVLHLHCREADVCGILDITAEQARKEQGLA
jgi:hypothetical protein